MRISAESAIPFGFRSGPEPVDGNRSVDANATYLGIELKRAFSAEGLIMSLIPGAMPQAPNEKRRWR